jgi:hypothetical protein
LAITGNVWIRAAIPDGLRIASLEAGDAVTGNCAGNWCKIAAGWVWRGCTDNNPARLGCQTK